MPISNKKGIWPTEYWFFWPWCFFSLLGGPCLKAQRSSHLWRRLTRGSLFFKFSIVSVKVYLYCCAWQRIHMVLLCHAVISTVFEGCCFKGLSIFGVQSWQISNIFKLFNYFVHCRWRAIQMSASCLFSDASHMFYCQLEIISPSFLHQKPILSSL